MRNFEHLRQQGGFFPQAQHVFDFIYNRYYNYVIALKERSSQELATPEQSTNYRNVTK